MKTLLVTPTYARLPYLGRCLAGFLQQDYPDKHLVFINDDKDVRLTCGSPNVTCINLTKKTPVDDKRNIGVSLGAFDIIMPTDDDDIILPTRVSNHVAQHTLYGVELYHNTAGYLIYGQSFTTGVTTPNAISYTKKLWHSVGGYCNADNNIHGDAVFYGKCPNKKIEENIRDYIYVFGGVNYHLTCTKEENIDRIAREQLASLNLTGKEFRIVPDFKEYYNFVHLAKRFDENGTFKL